MQELYDSDVLSEEAVLEWADQKEQDDEEDQVYFKKVRGRWGSQGAPDPASEGEGNVAEASGDRCSVRVVRMLNSASCTLP